MEWFSIPRQRVSAIIGVILSGYLIVLGLSIRPSDNHWLNRLDFLFYDTRFNASLALTPAKESEQSVVILDIDEKSLAEEGRWPWSRHKLADLVELLAEYGAVVVAFDVVFSEPERNAVKEVQSYLKANDVLWRPPEDWQVLADGDRNFSQKIPNMDVVLGFFFQDEENVQVGELPKGVMIFQRNSAPLLCPSVSLGTRPTYRLYSKLPAVAVLSRRFQTLMGLFVALPWLFATAMNCILHWV